MLAWSLNRLFIIISGYFRFHLFNDRDCVVDLRLIDYLTLFLLILGLMEFLTFFLKAYFVKKFFF